MQSLLRGWEVAHTLRAWLQDYIKLQLILTTQGILEIKCHKYFSCWQKQLCCARDEEGSESSREQDGETLEHLCADKCGPHSPAPQHHASWDNSQVFSWTTYWLQVQTRGTPVPGFVLTRKENPGSREILEWKKRGAMALLSHRSWRGGLRAAWTWKPLPS